MYFDVFGIGWHNQVFSACWCGKTIHTNAQGMIGKNFDETALQQAPCKRPLGVA